MRRVLHALEVRGPDAWPYIETRSIEVQLGPARAHAPSAPPTALPRWGAGAEPASAGDAVPLAPGVTAIHTPGHTDGSVCYLVAPELSGGDGVLFTGDHFALSGRLGRLDGFARYSRDTTQQAASMRALATEPFLHVLPGHGRRYSFADDAAREAELTAAADAYERDPKGVHAPGPIFTQPAA